MELFVILRRDGWRSGEELGAAAGAPPRKASVEAMCAGSAATCSRRRTGLGTVCIYEAESEEAIRGHAEDADLPVTEIIKVADTVIVRPDPEPAAAT